MARSGRAKLPLRATLVSVPIADFLLAPLHRTLTMTRRTYLALALALAALGLSLAFFFTPSSQRDAVQAVTVFDEGGLAPDPPELGNVRDVGGHRAAADLPSDVAVVREEAHRISGIVVDEHQVPVASAKCELLYGAEPTGLGGLVPRPRTEAKRLAQVGTDASGGFSFAVPKGFWTLRVTKAGMAPFEEAALRAGDFRWIELSPGVEVIVRAVDEGGAAVADADVRVVRGRFSDPQQARLTTRTDAGGEAVLGGVPAGTWFVRVAHSDFLPRVAMLPGRRSGAPSLDVVLHSGVTVQGRVTVGEDSAPASEGLVRFDADDGLVTSHTVRCDADGRYRSKLPFPRGSIIEVAAQASGYGELRQEVVIEVPADEWTLDHDVALDAEERTATGRVVSSDGSPLPGVEVYAHPLMALPPLTTLQIPGNAELRAVGPPDVTAFAPKASHRTLRWLAATTDAQGYFRAAALHPARPYGFLLLSEGRSNATLWLEPDAPGATFDFGSITLEEPGRVAGFVRRADGSAMEGAHVYAVESPTYTITADTEFTTTRPTALAGGLESTTSASGYFSIEPFPRRPFRLMCKGTMYGPFEFDDNGELAELELVAEDLHRRSAERAIPLSLKITDALGGPVPEAYVEVQRLAADAEDRQRESNAVNGWQWARGDESGSVRLTVSSAGRYAVTAKDMEGLLEASTVELDVEPRGAQRAIALDVSASPAGLLEGTVLSHVGEPLEHMAVTLIPVAGTTSCNCMKFNATTDDQGRFSFGHFMEGQHRIVVSDPTGALPPGQLYPASPGRPLTVRM